MKCFLLCCLLLFALISPALSALDDLQPAEEAHSQQDNWEVFWLLQERYNQGMRDEETLLLLGEAARKITYYPVAIRALRELLARSPEHASGRRELAKAYLQNEMPGEAYDLLLPALSQEDETTEEFLLLSLGAEQLVKPDESIQYLQTYLERAGPDPLARLKLATLYYRHGDIETARKELELLGSQAGHEEIEANAVSLLARIDQKQTRPWRLQFSTSYLYDSNANLGQELETILTSPQDYRGDPSDQEQGDHAWVLRGRLHHRTDLAPRWAWHTRSGFNRIDYGKIDSADYLNLHLATGPQVTPFAWNLSFPLIGQVTRYGQSTGADILRFGIAPRVRHRLSRLWHLQGNLLLQKNIDKEIKGRDSTVLTLSPTIYFKTSRVVASVGGVAGLNRAEDDLYSYRLTLLKTALSLKWLKGLRSSLWGEVYWRDYDEKEPGFEEERKDKTYRCGFSTLIALLSPKYQLNIGWKYLKNSSNIPMYRYDQSQFISTLHLNF